MSLGVGLGQNVGLGDFCHILTLLSQRASVLTHVELGFIYYAPSNEHGANGGGGGGVASQPITSSCFGYL